MLLLDLLWHVRLHLYCLRECVHQVKIRLYGFLYATMDQPLRIQRRARKHLLASHTSISFHPAGRGNTCQVGASTCTAGACSARAVSSIAAVEGAIASSSSGSTARREPLAISAASSA